MTRDSSRLRTATVGLVSISLFAALFARLWFLQVMNAGTYDKAANIAAYRTVVEPAPRGRILDRNGRVLVDNKSYIVVTVDTQALLKVKGADAMLSRLANLLNQYLPPPNNAYDKDTIRQRLRNKQVSPYKPVVIATDVPQALEIYLAEHADQFPAVTAERQTLRSYPFGTLGAHVLGYVGPIPDTMCKSSDTTCKVDGESVPYQKNDDIGRSGVEAAFEHYLRGTPGERTIEVDRAGNIVRTTSETKAVPGDDVYLTIDANAQAVAEQGLADGLKKAKSTPNALGYPPAPAGSMVVLDPSNGQVIALASNPTYSPAAFVPSISDDAYSLLTSPDSHYPFTDRAIAGQYPPGSTFKLVTSLAGLRTGLITPDYTYGDSGIYDIINCKGGQQGGCRIQGDQAKGHGPVNLSRALTVSSDTYYYRIGDELWRSSNNKNAIQDVAHELGFGQKTGIELTDEQAGVVYTADSLRKAHDANPQAFPYGANWYSGNNAHLAIGQDVVSATPLQLANAYATFANGGTRYQPTLLLKVLSFRGCGAVKTQQPKVLSKIDIPLDWRSAMLAGFEGVTTSGEGTAVDAFNSVNFPMGQFPVAGKTGTSQNNTDPKTGRTLQDNSLFVGFGPDTGPRYTAAAVVDFFLPLAKDGAFPQVQTVDGVPNIGQSCDQATPPATGDSNATTSSTGPGSNGPTTGSTILPLESTDPSGTSGTSSTTTNGAGH